MQNNNGDIIHIFGLRRSGNHLITQMMEKNAFPNRNVIFFNDVYNPRSKTPSILTFNDINIDSADNPVIILGYENVELQRVNNLPTVMAEEKILLKANTRRVLVIRDPYNFIASWIKMADTVLPNGEIFRSMRSIPIQEVKEWWKAYAREALGMTNFLGEKKLLIKYNDWVASRTYRDETISTNFGVENGDFGINLVSEYGKGSSFDGVSFSGFASLMDVHSRWKLYVEDPRYKLFARDKEVRDMSLELFGFTPESIEVNHPGGKLNYPG